MNNNIGVNNNCGCANGENLILILFLLMFLSPGMMFGNDSFILILFLLMFMPNFGNFGNFGRSVC